MAIPQLALGAGTKINTVSNKSVGVFIDWLPASTDDLKNMRTTDVKRLNITTIHPTQDFLVMHMS